jgi:heme-degrading monooxygenase HmoA
MFARVSTFQAAQDKGESAIGGPIPPEVQAMSGFKGAYALLNRESGKAMLITLWETQEAMTESAERAKQIRAQMVEEAGGTAAPQVETYEVITHG